MRSLFLAFTLCWIALAAWPLHAEEPPAAKKDRERLVLRINALPIGTLGSRLGELLLLEGRTSAEDKKINHFRVEKIDGVALAEPKFILVNLLKQKLPADTECAIYGYETIQMIGQAPAYEQLEVLRKIPAPPAPQPSWQMQIYFVALEVVKPEPHTQEEK